MSLLQAEILDVQRERSGAVAVYTNAPVPSQADVLVMVDWAHRFDLMQQHTGELNHTTSICAIALA